MSRSFANLFVTPFLVCVWLAFGLFAKVLNFAPRHTEIVARFFDASHARAIVIAIGLAEICMAVWVGSGRFRKLCASTQIAVVLGMNILEFFFAKDLLLMGPFNLLLATLFVGVVYVYGWVLHPTKSKDTPCH